nr:hypothetical protein [Actinoplanes sp. RD1]
MERGRNHGAVLIDCETRKAVDDRLLGFLGGPGRTLFLCDPARVGRLRDRRAALLQMPAQHHLSRGFPVLGGERGDDGIVQDVASVFAPAGVEGDPADR